MKTTDGDHDRERDDWRHLVDGHRHTCQPKNNRQTAVQSPSGGRLPLLVLAMFWACGVVGCLGTDNSKLVGRWEGHSSPSPAGDSSDSETNDPASASHTQFTTILIFQPDYRFSMELVSNDGQTRQTQGSWQIDQATGTRWEVTLRQEDTQASVRLRIAFDEEGFTARQVDGDDRIDSIHYRRVGE
jgi:hypothetical protein